MQLPLPTGFFVKIPPQCNAPLYEFDSVSDSVESEAEGKGSQDATQIEERKIEESWAEMPRPKDLART